MAFVGVLISRDGQQTLVAVLRSIGTYLTHGGGDHIGASVESSSVVMVEARVETVILATE